MSEVPSLPAVKSWQAAFDAQRASALQRRSFADFLARGLPSTKLDSWKYTDLRRLTMKQFKLPTNAAAVDISELLLKVGDCHRLVFVDGQLDRSLSTPATKGLSIGAFDPVATSERNNDPSAFELLNAALASDSVNIAIAANQVLAQPIYIACVWSSTAGALMMHPRVQVSVGQNSTATLIEHHVGENSDATFTNTLIDIAVGEHAALEHIRVQDDATANFNIASVHAAVAREASYINHHYALGSSLSRTDLSIQLCGLSARTELHGLMFARDAQHLDVRTCINHQVPDTRSIEDYRGIADHRGRVVFNGKVIVSKDAQRTDASQSSRNLLLSPHAEIDTRPELEIYANDVKCAHGATVGQLDASALFYLQSRGIARHEARALLTHAFAAELIERAPVAAVRDHVLARLMSRMRAEGATP